MEEYVFPHNGPCRCVECNSVLMRFIADYAEEIKERMDAYFEEMG